MASQRESGERVGSRDRRGAGEPGASRPIASSWALCALFALLAVGGCAQGGQVSNSQLGSGEPGCVDSDEDGFDAVAPDCEGGEDCNDQDASIYPGAEEICGDGADNDCQGGDGFCMMERDCVDLDGDRYGAGIDCVGPDCDDSDPSINPAAQEICDNNVDENCLASDDVCPANCEDNDRDGFGVEGKNADCPMGGVDCDDQVATVNPASVEICNGRDDDCDDNIDECVVEGAVCSGTEQGSRCQVGLDGPCEMDMECGEGLRCDDNQRPPVCRLAEGEGCRDGECFTGLVCEAGSCSGDYCATANCAAPTQYCDQGASRCVECRHWAQGTADCPAGESCLGGGQCGQVYTVSSSQVVAGSSGLRQDVLEVSRALADCLIAKDPLEELDLCVSFVVGAQIDGSITDGMLESAFKDGDLDDYLSGDQLRALDDIWGIGLFDLRSLEWIVNLTPGSSQEICLWYEPAGSFVGRKRLYVDRCENYRD